MVAQHLLPCTQAEAQGLGWEVAGSSPQTPTGRDQGPDSPSSWETCAPGSGELGLCSQALEGQSLCTPLGPGEDSGGGSTRGRWGQMGTGGWAAGGSPAETTSRGEVPSALCRCV